MTDDMQDDKRIALGSTIKSLGNNRIGGYLVRFTDEDRKDLYGEFFTKDTDYHLDDFTVKGSPVLFHHGLDETIRANAIGTVDTVKVDDKGIWVEAKLKEYDEYVEMVKELLDQDVLGWSSGALPQTVRVAENGYIEEWAIVEASATHTPAAPFDTRITSIRSLKPLALRGRVKQDDARGVTVSTSGGSVANVSIEYDTNETPTGEITVNKKQTTKLHSALKMLDEEAKQEVQGMIEQYVMEYVGMALEEQRMAEEIDEDAARAAEDDVVEDVIEEVVDEMEGKAEGDPEEVEEEVKAFIAGTDFARTAVQSWMVRYHEHKSKKRDLVKTAMAATRKEMEATPAKSRKHNAGGVDKPLNYEGAKSSAVSVGNDLRYAHLSASDMAFGMMAMRAQAKGVPQALRDNPLSYVGEEYFKNFAGKALERVNRLPDIDHTNSHKARVIASDHRAMKAGIPIKADEFDASDITGQGLEWVGDYWSNEVWLKARYNLLFDRFVSGGMNVIDIPQGSDSVKVPLEGSDPVVYSSPQANDLDAVGLPETTANINAFGTANGTLTPGQLMVAVAYTTELDEDSVVNVGAFVNESMQKVALEHIDKSIINGDTETAATTNINLIDNTPGTGTSRPYYLVTNGFRKLPLVTATAQSRDAGAVLGIDDFRSTLALIDGELRQNKNNMLFIIDPNTEMAALALSEIATDDVRRTAATITSGVLQNIYGIDVATSGFLPLANAAGKVPAAGGTLGTILLPYLPYWWFGYKRRITLETDRIITSQTDVYVLSMRIGLLARGTNAAALSYNTTL